MILSWRCHCLSGRRHCLSGRVGPIVIIRLSQLNCNCIANWNWAWQNLDLSGVSETFHFFIILFLFVWFPFIAQRCILSRWYSPDASPISSYIGGYYLLQVAELYLDSMGSTLPEHLRFFPGTHKKIGYQHSVKIALFFHISHLVPVA